MLTSATPAQLNHRQLLYAFKILLPEVTNKLNFFGIKMKKFFYRLFAGFLRDYSPVKTLLNSLHYIQSILQIKSEYLCSTKLVTSVLCVEKREMKSCKSIFSVLNLEADLRMPKMNRNEL